jgi:hypothetical protein
VKDNWELSGKHGTSTLARPFVFGSHQTGLTGLAEYHEDYNLREERPLQPSERTGKLSEGLIGAGGTILTFAGPASGVVKGLRPGDISKPGLPGGCFVAGTKVRMASEFAFALPSSLPDATSENDPTAENFVDVEEVQLGSRVPDKVPNGEEYDFSLPEVVRSTWRQVNLTVKRKDGSLVEMQLLRPIEWIASANLSAGVEVDLSASDIEIDGRALVKSIVPCPEIAPGDGNVVIGRFVTRLANNLVEVTLENGTTFTGTSNHPIWIPAQQAFIELGGLDSGVTLDTLLGPICVTSIKCLERVSDVFNIEVHGHHVYRISEDGVLVHNNSMQPAPNRTRFPSTADEMDDFLGFPGTKKPDGPTTPGRDKTIWKPNADTKITFERHPYHPDAPDWHRDYHWHLDTPGRRHQRFLPGDEIPGLGGRGN